MTPSDHAAGCEGKDQFDTWWQAHRVVKKSRNAHQVYRCAFCGKFHIAG